jgi:hypothetical protein
MTSIRSLQFETFEIGWLPDENLKASRLILVTRVR